MARARGSPNRRTYSRPSDALLEIGRLAERLFALTHQAESEQEEGAPPFMPDYAETRRRLEERVRAELAQRPQGARARLEKAIAEAVGEGLASHARLRRFLDAADWGGDPAVRRDELLGVAVRGEEALVDRVLVELKPADGEKRSPLELYPAPKDDASPEIGEEYRETLQGLEEAVEAAFDWLSEQPAAPERCARAAWQIRVYFGGYPWPFEPPSGLQRDFEEEGGLGPSLELAVCLALLKALLPRWAVRSGEVLAGKWVIATGDVTEERKVVSVGGFPEKQAAALALELPLLYPEGWLVPRRLPERWRKPVTDLEAAARRMFPLLEPLEPTTVLRAPLGALQGLTDLDDSVEALDAMRSSPIGLRVRMRGTADLRTLEDAVAAQRRVRLASPSGAGKSTALANLYDRCYRGLAGESLHLVPCYVELTGAYELLESPDALLEAVAAILEVEVSDLSVLARECGLLLLIDAARVKSPREFFRADGPLDRVLRLLADANSRIVVARRPQPYGEVSLHGPMRHGWTELTLEPVSEDQARSYLAHTGRPPAEVEQALAAVGGVQGLGGLPIVLALLARLLRADKAPSASATKADVYRTALLDWLVHKVELGWTQDWEWGELARAASQSFSDGNEVAMGLIRDPDTQRQVTATWGYLAELGGRCVELDRPLSRAEVEQVIHRLLPERDDPTASTLLDAYLGECPVLSWSDGALHFLHDSLAEYFAAEHRQAQGTLAPDRPGWEGVLEFQAALGAEEAVVEKLLADPRAWHFLTAARCASASRSPIASGRVRRRLRDELVKVPVIDEWGAVTDGRDTSPHNPIWFDWPVEVLRQVEDGSATSELTSHVLVMLPAVGKGARGREREKLRDLCGRFVRYLIGLGATHADLALIVRCNDTLVACSSAQALIIESGDLPELMQGDLLDSVVEVAARRADRELKRFLLGRVVTGFAQGESWARLIVKSIARFAEGHDQDSGLANALRLVENPTADGVLSHEALHSALSSLLIWEKVDVPEDVLVHAERVWLMHERLEVRFWTALLLLRSDRPAKGIAAALAGRLNPLAERHASKGSHDESQPGEFWLVHELLTRSTALTNDLYEELRSALIPDASALLDLWPTDVHGKLDLAGARAGGTTSCPPAFDVLERPGDDWKRLLDGRNLTDAESGSTLPEWYGRSGPLPADRREARRILVREDWLRPFWSGWVGSMADWRWLTDATLESELWEEGLLDHGLDWWLGVLTAADARYVRETLDQVSFDELLDSAVEEFVVSKSKRQARIYLTLGRFDSPWIDDLRERIARALSLSAQDRYGKPVEELGFAVRRWEAGRNAFWNELDALEDDVAEEWMEAVLERCLEPEGSFWEENAWVGDYRDLLGGVLDEDLVGPVSAGLRQDHPRPTARDLLGIVWDLRNLQEPWAATLLVAIAQYGEDASVRARALQCLLSRDDHDSAHALRHWLDAYEQDESRVRPLHVAAVKLWLGSLAADSFEFLAWRIHRARHVSFEPEDYWEYSGSPHEAEDAVDIALAARLLVRDYPNRSRPVLEEVLWFGIDSTGEYRRAVVVALLEEDEPARWERSPIGNPGFSAVLEKLEKEAHLGADSTKAHFQFAAQLIDWAKRERVEVLRGMRAELSRRLQETGSAPEDLRDLLERASPTAETPPPPGALQG